MTEDIKKDSSTAASSELENDPDYDPDDYIIIDLILQLVNWIRGKR